MFLHVCNITPAFHEVSSVSRKSSAAHSNDIFTFLRNCVGEVKHEIVYKVALTDEALTLETTVTVSLSFCGAGVIDHCQNFC